MKPSFYYKNLSVWNSNQLIESLIISAQFHAYCAPNSVAGDCGTLSIVSSCEVELILGSQKTHYKRRGKVLHLSHLSVMDYIKLVFLDSSSHLLLEIIFSSLSYCHNVTISSWKKGSRYKQTFALTAQITSFAMQNWFVLLIYTNNTRYNVNHHQPSTNHCPLSWKWDDTFSVQQ